MKYIKTKDGRIYEVTRIIPTDDDYYFDTLEETFSREEVLKEADTIEELCDGFDCIVIDKDEEEDEYENNNRKQRIR